MDVETEASSRFPASAHTSGPWAAPDRCTCGPARDWDGSENGYCSYCEAVNDGFGDEDLQEIADRLPDDGGD